MTTPLNVKHHGGGSSASRAERRELGEGGEQEAEVEDVERLPTVGRGTVAHKESVDEDAAAAVDDGGGHDDLGGVAMLHDEMVAANREEELPEASQQSLEVIEMLLVGERFLFSLFRRRQRFIFLLKAGFFGFISFVLLSPRGRAGLKRCATLLSKIFLNIISIPI